MSPTQSGGFGSCGELSEEGGRPRGIPWFATHRIVYSRSANESERIEVMAWDRGAEAPGPARYALYQQEDAEAECAPEWAMDTAGRLWLRNEPLLDGATAVVEDVWA